MAPVLGSTVPAVSVSPRCARAGARAAGPAPPHSRSRHAACRCQGSEDRGSTSGGDKGRARKDKNPSSNANPMGAPNFWEYGTPGDYSSPSSYRAPGQYQVPFKYSPAGGAPGPISARASGGGGSGGGTGGGGRKGGSGGSGGSGGRGGSGGDKWRSIRKVGWLVALLYASLGLIGYVMANSTASLVGGAALSTPFAIASLLMELNAAVGLGVGLAFSVVVFAYCVKKFRKSGKLMPAGLLLSFSTWSLISYLRAIVGA